MHIKYKLTPENKIRQNILNIDKKPKYGGGYYVNIDFYCLRTLSGVTYYVYGLWRKGVQNMVMFHWLLKPSVTNWKDFCLFIPEMIKLLKRGGVGCWI